MFKTIFVPKYLLPVQAFLIVLAIVALMTNPSSETKLLGNDEGRGTVSDPSESLAPGEQAVVDGSPSASESPAAASPGAKAGGSPPPADEKLRAPRPGRYRYHFKYSSSGGPQGQPSQGEKDVTSVVSTTQETPSEVQQQMRIDEFSSSFDLSWKQNAVHLTRLSQGQFQCDFEPDFQQYGLPLKRGASWTVDTGCPFTVQGQQGRYEVHEEARVTGTEQIQIAGTTVDAFVIERTQTSNAKNSAGAVIFTVDKTSKEWFSLRHQLPVKISEKSKSTSGTNSAESTSDQEVLNLNPE